MEHDDRPESKLACLFSLGGSGSTLLARFLACMEQTVLLSECNPSSALLYGGDLNPYTQVRDWYPDLFDRETSDRPQDLAEDARFCDFVQRIAALAESRGIQLIIRDYSYVDFVGVPFTWDPPQASSLLRALAGAFDIRGAVLVRHPLKQYDSLRSHANLENVLSPDIFVAGYDSFLQTFRNLYLLRYEDLVERPHECVSELCHHLNLRFSPGFIDRFVAVRSVTGDLHRADDSSVTFSDGSGPRDAWRTELQESPAYAALLTRLGYDAVPHEDRAGRVKQRVATAKAETMRVDIYAESEPLALLGPGWYGVEKSARGEEFRWVGPDAALNVARLTPDGQLVRLDIEPGPAVGLSPFRLGIYEDGAQVATLDVVERTTVEFLLPPGEPRVHRLSLHAEGGGDPVEAPGDRRTLNFRIFKIALVPVPATSVKELDNERAMAEAALRIGQLEELLGAERRERSDLERRLSREVEGRDVLIARLEGTNAETRGQMDELSRAIAEREARIAELQALAEERLNVIRAMNETSETH